MTTISTLGQSLDQISNIRVLQDRLNNLQRQVTTGRKADSFSDLGSSALTTQRARSKIYSLENYSRNIDIADIRIELANSSMNEIVNQAKNVSEMIGGSVQQGEVDLEAIENLTKNAFEFIGDLLNAQDGDRYLFGGSETRTQPYNDNGNLESYVSAQVNEWINVNIDTDEFIQQYRDEENLPDTLVGFNAALSSGNVNDVSVRVDNNAELTYGVQANEDPFRDILVALKTIETMASTLDEVDLDENADPGTVTAPGLTGAEQQANFYQVLNDLTVMINDAAEGVQSRLSDVAFVQVQMKSIQEDHTRQINIQNTLISDIEEVDLDEVAIKFNSLLSQLEASYSVTASVRGLSLVNFL
mgnify:CR=1 FL=1